MRMIFISLSEKIVRFSLRYMTFFVKKKSQLKNSQLRVKAERSLGVIMEGDFVQGLRWEEPRFRWPGEVADQVRIVLSPRLLKLQFYGP